MGGAAREKNLQIHQGYCRSVLQIDFSEFKAHRTRWNLLPYSYFSWFALVSSNFRPRNGEIKNTIECKIDSDRPCVTIMSCPTVPPFPLWGRLGEEKRIFSPNRSQGDHDSNDVWVFQKGLWRYELANMFKSLFKVPCFPRYVFLYWYFMVFHLHKD